MDCFSLRVSRLDDAALAEHDAALLRAACGGGEGGGGGRPHPAPASQAAEAACGQPPVLRATRRFHSGPSRAAAAAAVDAAGAPLGFGGLPLPVTAPLTVFWHLLQAVSVCLANSQHRDPDCGSDR